MFKLLRLPLPVISISPLMVGLLAGCGVLDVPRCTLDGRMPTGGSTCCSEQRDQSGICCSGKECMPKLPDLKSQQFQINYFTPAPPNTNELTVCVNANPDGTVTDTDEHFVTIVNLGEAPTGPFKVGVSIQHATDPSKLYSCPARFENTPGIAPHQQWTYKGPFCCSVDTTGVSPGAYRVFFMPDIDMRVAESDETNNGWASFETTLP